MLFDGWPGPHLVLKLGILLVSIAIAVIEFRGSKSSRRGVGLVALTLFIGVLAVTFVDQMIETQEEVENTRRTLNEIQRAVERIERVRTYAEVVVRPVQSFLGAYRDRLENSESSCLKKPGNLLEMKDPLRRRIPRTYLVEDECLPDPFNEAPVSSALGFLSMDLRFYKSARPSLQCSGEGLANSRPDLAISLLASLNDENLQLLYDREHRYFILRAQDLESDSFTFEGNGRIAAVGDLADARMVIELRSLGLQRSEADELSRSMQISRIRMRFAGAHTYIVDSSEDPLAETQQVSSVDYLYCFPGDLEAKHPR